MSDEKRKYPPQAEHWCGKCESGCTEVARLRAAEAEGLKREAELRAVVITGLADLVRMHDYKFPGRGARSYLDREGVMEAVTRIRRGMNDVATRVAMASTGAKEAAPSPGAEETASYERLRAKLGGELSPVRFIQCDRCEQVRPESEIDHDSASGINLCRDLKCATPPETTETRGEES